MGLFVYAVLVKIRLNLPASQILLAGSGQFRAVCAAMENPHPLQVSGEAAAMLMLMGLPPLVLLCLIRLFI